MCLVDETSNRTPLSLSISMLFSSPSSPFCTSKAMLLITDLLWSRHVFMVQVLFGDKKKTFTLSRCVSPGPPATSASSSTLRSDNLHKLAVPVVKTKSLIDLGCSGKKERKHTTHRHKGRKGNPASVFLLLPFVQLFVWLFLEISKTSFIFAQHCASSVGFEAVLPPARPAPPSLPVLYSILFHHFLSSLGEFLTEHRERPSVTVCLSPCLWTVSILRVSPLTFPLTHCREHTHTRLTLLIQWVGGTGSIHFAHKKSSATHTLVLVSLACVRVCLYYQPPPWATNRAPSR